MQYNVAHNKLTINIPSGDTTASVIPIKNMFTITLISYFSFGTTLWLKNIIKGNEFFSTYLNICNIIIFIKYPLLK